MKIIHGDKVKIIYGDNMIYTISRPTWQYYYNCDLLIYTDDGAEIIRIGSFDCMGRALLEAEKDAQDRSSK